jgi:mannose/fructose/N-acetylgalactosamine-specific phosphotransferase system component IIB
VRNIVLARVDDRLIHGEVVSVWTPNLSANRIVVADDDVAADKFNSKLLKLLAPAGVKVNVYTVNEASEKLRGEFRKDEKIIVLAKTPISFEKMINDGLELKHVNLGGMGLRDGRTQFIKNVSCSPEEVESIKKMMDKGVHVFYQLVPEQQVIEVSEVIKKRKE